MSILKIFGGLIAAAAFAYVAWLYHDHHALAAQHKDALACVAAATTADAALTACPVVIGERVRTARQADACETALSARATSGYAIRATCGEQVKKLDAMLTASDASLADAAAQLRTAAVDRDGAVQRAEARATSTADRKAANDATIAKAPRVADGIVRCDAQCLRNLVQGQ
ncbi:hypothetical protein BH09PSE4_BH09PSE4_21230 [soil metagenome]